MPRKSNSCAGIAGEVTSSDLDEDTLQELSMSNRMVKAMFESSAPKYKFGGSGSNLALNSSKEDVRKPVMKQSAKPKEERKWVLDSINKFFDVIVEEEDEEDEENEENEDSDITDDDDYEYEDDEDEKEDEPVVSPEEKPGYRSSTKMRSLLGSVMGKLSSSTSNLSTTNLVSSLKRNLGSQISIRASNQDLSSP